MDPRLKDLPLEQIQTAPLLQVRSDKVLSGSERDRKSQELEQQHQRLLRIIDSGSYLEPIQVIEENGTFLVFDGHHRLEAYLERLPASARVPVEILPYSFADALAKGYMVNALHGASLRDRERTQACFRSLLFSADEIPTSELQLQGISLSLAQKLKKAAVQLKQETAISPSDSVEVRLDKVRIWTKQEIKRNGEHTGGRPSFVRDEHGIPSYRYVLERKALPAELSDEARLGQMVAALEKHLESDPFTFRQAVKRLSKRHDLKIRVSNWEVSKSSEGLEDNDDL